MSTFFSLFDQIRIVSLAEREDRRREVAAEFERIGEAIDGRRTRYFIAQRPKELHDFPNLGAHGCFMSHLTILREAAEAGAERLLVLEDDVRFSKEFRQRDAELSEALSGQRWDVFYGGFQLDQRRAASISAASASEAGLQIADPGMLIMQTHCVGLAGPVIPRVVSYLEAMLQRPTGDPEGGPMHVDGTYSWFRKAHPEIRTLFASPPIALQRSSKSDIYENTWIDRLPLVRHAVRVARHVKNKLD